jgi:hypothetical protein
MDKTESSVTITAKVTNGTVEIGIEFDIGDDINQEQMLFLAADALMAVDEQMQAKDAGEDETV